MTAKSALDKCIGDLAAASRDAATVAIDAGATGLSNDDAFWRQVERILGRDRYEPIFDNNGPAVVADICSDRLRANGRTWGGKPKTIDGATALALRTLRAAALRRSA